MIHLSTAAATEIKRLQQVNSHPNSYLRITVASGGCSDLYYILDLIEHPESRDRQYESQGVAIAIDAALEATLSGLKLDYSEDLMGGGFRFHNPNAANSCSCGQSFSLAS
ncbi:MAG: iron-sulfur cluster assembly accessory protein [Jaaginema sp. PMC 1079.18]|nr:iron-sulfur cluster assembly accessory protein [Jaaginema sp. PMC 1080.18]MEC4852424.1 iron-sulfur cluster assembly accessory protein [Jaaginema sp. PMC 1079.18]MEC4868392.1 iron-sulfur cluster assembly accessory protein [Jaaginema sp. PMC 1078.18]